MSIVNLNESSLEKWLTLTNQTFPGGRLLVRLLVFGLYLGTRLQGSFEGHGHFMLVLLLAFPSYHLPAFYKLVDASNEEDQGFEIVPADTIDLVGVVMGKRPREQLAEWVIMTSLKTNKLLQNTVNATLCMCA